MAEIRPWEIEGNQVLAFAVIARAGTEDEPSRAAEKPEVAIRSTSPGRAGRESGPRVTPPIKLPFRVFKGCLSRIYD
jgi:hypothetical protein